jgi:hypothetical protein
MIFAKQRSDWPILLISAQIDIDKPSLLKMSIFMRPHPAPSHPSRTQAVSNEARIMREVACEKSRCSAIAAAG